MEVTDANILLIKVAGEVFAKAFGEGGNENAIAFFGE